MMIKRVSLAVLATMMFFACDNEENGPDITAPDSVKGFQAVRGANTGDMLIELAWEKNKEPDLAGYILKRKDNTELSFSFLDTVHGESYIDTVDSYSLNYSYEITAFDNSGNVSLPNDNAHGIMSPNILPPNEVANISVKATNRGLNKYINLAWETSDADIDSVKITRESATDKKIIMINGSTNKFRDDSITVGVLYSYSIKAIDFGNNESLGKIKISDVALAKPVFVSPINDSIVTTPMVTFIWNKVNLATSYELILNQSKDLLDTIVAPVVGDNMSLTLDLSKIVGLQQGIPLSWNVITYSKDSSDINSSADKSATLIYNP